MKFKQRTIAHAVSARGMGVHSGRWVDITLAPAAIDTGINFHFVDVNNKILAKIKAHASQVGDTSLSTCLVQGEFRISTIEHLMSAIYGLGIDNLEITINASEVPIMDGSAQPYVFLLQSAGMVQQKAAKKFLIIKKKITLQEGDKIVSIEPFDGFCIDFSIDFEHFSFKDPSQRRYEFLYSVLNFSKEISRARTFGFMRDIKMLREAGLALGGSLANALVFSEEDGLLNKEGLRYQNECVRHKILDVVGDISLLGYPIFGLFKGFKSGHDLNNKLLRKLLAEPDAWEVVEDPDTEQDLAQVFAWTSLATVEN
jgi:UDP-3-O-[3-hydroxymyristoyl] N-acetylglucosamine deacetylase